MDESLFQAYGRLTVHEMLLEVLYARQLADMEPDDADDFVKQFGSLMSEGWTPDDAENPDEGQRLLRDAEDLSARFWSKVVRRAASIRAARVQGR